MPRRALDPWQANDPWAAAKSTKTSGTSDKPQPVLPETHESAAPFEKLDMMSRCVYEGDQELLQGRRWTICGDQPQYVLTIAKFVHTVIALPAEAVPSLIFVDKVPNALAKKVDAQKDENIGQE